jgi:transglutaminase-like putative cysteine protease
LYLDAKEMALITWGVIMAPYETPKVTIKRPPRINRTVAGVERPIEKNSPASPIDIIETPKLMSVPVSSKEQKIRLSILSQHLSVPVYLPSISTALMLNKFGLSPVLSVNKIGLFAQYAYILVL